MTLEQILQGIETLEIVGATDCEIQHLSQDSRDQELTGGLYFAVPGTVVDGHGFIQDVVDAGARAVVCEHLPESLAPDVTFIRVHDVKKVMGMIASTFYGNPSSALTVIALTGTNGKTSIATYVSQALEHLDQKVLLLSTAGDYFDGKIIEVKRKATSSLEIIELHKLLRTYVDQGATHCCLEATSIALDQDRLSGIDIDIAIFTNLTQDHIDYHKNFEDYGRAKSLLFTHLKESGIAISNFDDAFGETILSETKAKIISYGKSNDSYDYSFTIENTNSKGTVCKINNHTLELPIIGEFNIYNATAAYAVLSELALPAKNVVAGLEHIDAVAGRMQTVDNDRGIIALVDYAHTPDALQNVLRTLKDISHDHIITVFGCGGDRDRSKRPIMARIGQDMSDTVMYTSDNPRTESLEQIFDDMREGIDADVPNFHFIESREEAICTAVTMAQKGDIILVAGKGHEDYQIIGTEKLHFDDREVLEKCFKKTPQG